MKVDIFVDFSRLKLGIGKIIFRVKIKWVCKLIFSILTLVDIASTVDIALRRNWNVRLIWILIQILRKMFAESTFAWHIKISFLLFKDRFSFVRQNFDYSVDYKIMTKN